MVRHMININKLYELKNKMIEVEYQGDVVDRLIRDYFNDYERKRWERSVGRAWYNLMAWQR